nr:hypothetical protein [uncultured Dyadobacter sp.]
MEYAKQLLALATILKKSKKVNSFNNEKESEADTLSHALLDLEESFSAISNNLLPKLQNDTLNEEDIDDILLDIGEELRHILYHINAPKYYQYLKFE